jgi:hypothetical protein
LTFPPFYFGAFILLLSIVMLLDLFRKVYFGVSSYCIVFDMSHLLFIC